MTDKALPTDCSVCNGSGWVIDENGDDIDCPAYCQNTADRITTCTTCQGIGWAPDREDFVSICPACFGVGKIKVVQPTETSSTAKNLADQPIRQKPR